MNGKELLIPSILLFLAAVIFSGTIVWQDLRAPKASQTQVMPMNVAATETDIVHYIAGNITGTITSIQGNTIQLSVLAPNAGDATSTASGSATVIVDSDTQMYKAGALKTPAEMAQDQANAAKDPSDASDPFEHIPLTISQLTVGMIVNVLPKNGTVQGTTFHAQTLTSGFTAAINPAVAPQPPASVGTSSAPATQ